MSKRSGKPVIRDDSDEYLDDALLLMRQFMDCFFREDRYWQHNSTDGVVEVSEDLQTVLTEVDEFLENMPE